ncbi:prenyltransferase/squalene oxidase repeat-containing protein [Nocardioides conyzicola]|uniref:prenyltransferase/squalene oxidase repeat-containing protein n=1 Tax=Nocardioides conyzicola TaxID=1651781 RepID=UPI0031F15327
MAVPTLALAALAATPGTASAAGTDPVAADSAATWLTSQLSSGIVHNDQYDFDDLGLSADVALGLHRIGGHDATVSAIADAIEPRAHDEWYTSTYEGQTTLYAGSLAKAAVLAQAAGSSTADFGGHDLIAELESRVGSTAPINGRVVDENNEYGDTNAFGQAYAAQALVAADSPKAGAVTNYLLEQQCAAGWFRLDFPSRSSEIQTCEGDATSQPDTDATAIAVLALTSQSADVDVAEKLALAKSWLESSQKADGSFGGGPSTEAANANSTGLAGTALAALGDTSAAAKAAVWVRAHQVTNAGSCTTYAAADTGSIAYDDTALSEVDTTPIAAETADQFRRATAQALPVLQWAPAGPGVSALFTAEYVKAGTKPRVGVVGAAPGETLCAAAGTQKVARVADANGEAQFPIALGAKTATTRVTISTAGGVADTATIKALGAKKLPIKLKAKVRKGTTQTVRVTGLAPGETVRVKLLGKTRSGQATRKGVFVASAKATGKYGKPGTFKVTVVGEFANRKGSKTFKVVR